ncbi:MAG: TIGR02147 family protein, partial [Bdellovibrionota bacterium]
MEIFQYSDYRTYLADFYRREKERKKGFSYRSFARLAGLSSANYLKLVIDGTRPLTEKNMAAFLRGLKLQGPAAEYFRVLVNLKEGRDEKARGEVLERLLKLRLKHSGDPLQLNKDRWEILRSWHHWAIREMALLSDFKAEPEWIAKRLGRKITPAQAKESLELLLRLEFLKKT